MLQIVRRPSIESARIASPAYSTTWPTAAAHADAADRAEDHVLRRDAERQLAPVEDAHRLRPDPRQALRREHVLDLGRADPERERAERAVRGGVAVAADDRHPGLRQAQLGADHVHDPLAPAARSRRAGPRTRRSSRASASSCARASGSDGPRRRRHVVVHRREREVGPPHRRPARRSPSNACADVTSWIRWRST